MGKAGALWYVNPKDDFVEGVEFGINHFKHKYGVNPQAIELNLIHEIKQIKGIPCVPSRSVSKSHAFFIYGDDSLVLSDLAKKEE